MNAGEHDTPGTMTVPIDDGGTATLPATATAAEIAAAHRGTRPSPAAMNRFIRAVIAKFEVCPVCSYLWRECECGIGANELPPEPVSSGSEFTISCGPYQASEHFADPKGVWDTWGGDGVGP